MGLIGAGSGKDPGAPYQRRRNIGGAESLLLACKTREAPIATGATLISHPGFRSRERCIEHRAATGSKHPTLDLHALPMSPRVYHVSPRVGSLYGRHRRTLVRIRMLCDPGEILRQRIHLVIKSAIRELRRFGHKLIVPKSALRQLNQAATDDATMLAQALDFIASGRDRHQLHSILWL